MALDVVLIRWKKEKCIALNTISRHNETIQIQ